jgi:hypothetical protein
LELLPVLDARFEHLRRSGGSLHLAVENMLPDLVLRSIAGFKSEDLNQGGVFIHSYPKSPASSYF